MFEEVLSGSVERSGVYRAHLKDDAATQKWLGQLLVQLGYSL